MRLSARRDCEIRREPVSVPVRVLPVYQPRCVMPLIFVPGGYSPPPKKNPLAGLAGGFVVLLFVAAIFGDKDKKGHTNTTDQPPAATQPAADMPLRTA